VSSNGTKNYSKTTTTNNKPKKKKKKGWKEFANPTSYRHNMQCAHLLATILMR